MRGTGGTQDPAGPGLGASRFGAAPAACPWGCVLGPGGWSGAPVCPLHRLPGAAEAERSRWQVPSCLANRGAMGEVTTAWDAFGRGLAFWNDPGGLEESSEEEVDEDGEWIGFGPPCEDGGFAYSFCGLEGPFLCQEPLGPRLPPAALGAKMPRLPAPWRHQLTAEEAEKNARELVAEEERAKKKAEKKKLKKKKQKDRKKQEKLEQELKNKQETEASTSSPSSAAGAGHPQNSSAEEGEGKPPPSSSSCLRGSAAPSGREGGKEGRARKGRAEEMEDELDLSCAFVSKAWQKAGGRLRAPGKERPGSAEPGRRAPGKAPKPKPVPPDMSVVEQSLVLAGRGNEAAQQGRYTEAVRAFTEAMKLNPGEHRLFGNRSYCYEKLGRYEEALRDAQVSLGLQPGWPKGFFRKGKALRGLERYAEAARTFEELLHRNGASAEVGAQLEACRALLQRSSLGRVPVSQSLLEAGEMPSPPSAGERASGSCRDTDTSGFATVVSSKSQGKGQGRPAASSQPALPPTHPARDCYPLWVGNVTPRISEKVLRGSFSRFGEIRFIRLLPERRCAFVNYARKAAAEAAFGAMQDAEVEGSRLVLQLKHPSHATPSPRRYPEPRGEVGAPPGGL